MDSWKELLVVGAALVLASAPFVGCNSEAAVKTAAEGQGVTLVSQVVVSPVKVVDQAVSLDLLGTVRAQTVVPVGGAVPGRVESVLVREGDLVKKGQILVSLEKQDARLRLQQAETAIQQAEKQIEAMTLAGEVEKEALQIGVKQAQAAVSQARANLQKIERGARPEERSQVAAAVEAARAQVEAMQREVNRLQPLFENNVIPKSQLEKVADGQKLAAAQYDAAAAQLALVRKGARDEDKDAVKAAVEQVEAVLELAQASQRRTEIRMIELEAARLGLGQAEIARQMAQRGLEETDIVSPCDGLVQKRNVEAGAIVGPGVPLLLVTPVASVALEMVLTDGQRAQLTPAATAAFLVEALGKRGEGRVDFAADTVDPMRGGYVVRVGLSESLARETRDGMFCRVTLSTGRVKKGTVLVPADSVLHREGRKVVFVIENDKALMKTVETGSRQNGSVEVTSGLAGNEQVVVDGHLNLIDGASVSLAEAGDQVP